MVTLCIAHMRCSSNTLEVTINSWLLLGDSVLFEDFQAFFIVFDYVNSYQYMPVEIHNILSAKVKFLSKL